jgi:hypothetical protein
VSIVFEAKEKSEQLHFPVIHIERKMKREIFFKN